MLVIICSNHINFSLVGFCSSLLSFALLTILRGLFKISFINSYPLLMESKVQATQVGEWGEKILGSLEESPRNCVENHGTFSGTIYILAGQGGD